MRLLSASYLLPIRGEVIADGAVVVDGGEIVAVGPTPEITRQFPEAKKERFERAVLMPGLVNAHTHLELLRFEGDSSRYLSWLLASWDYRKRLSPSERRDSFSDGVRQLLRVGTTCMGDSGNYAGLASTARSLPIRSVLFPEILTSGEAAIQESFEAAFTQVEEIRAARGAEETARLSAGIAPYAAYTLSRHLLKVVGQHAAAHGIPVKIHAAETFAEMQFFFESKGELADELFPKLGWKEELPPPHRKTPIGYLESIGLLEVRPILVGCIHLGENDLAAVARAGARVVLTPRANAHRKLGAAPLKKILRAGIPVGFGTDGTSSLFSLSLWDELRFIVDNTPKEECPAPHELLEIATWGGAKVLGLGRQIGTLEPGKRADLIVVSLPAKLTASDLPGWLIRNGGDQRVTAVFVDGEKVDSLARAKPDAR